MYMLVYVSSAVDLFTDDELKKLLEKSRKNNSALGITGMLLYKEGNFMQFLEGPKQAVADLVTKIKADPRHRGVLLLLQEEHAHREFEQWAMAFKKLDPDSSVDAEGYSEFLDLPLNSQEFVDNPSRTLKLLMSFRQTVG